MKLDQSCSEKKLGSIGAQGKTPAQIVMVMLPPNPCEQIYKVTLVSGHQSLAKNTLARTGYLSLDLGQGMAEFWTLKMVTLKNIKAASGLRETMTRFVQDVEADKQTGDDARCVSWEGAKVQNAGGLFITLRGEGDPGAHATFRVEGPG